MSRETIIPRGRERSRRRANRRRRAGALLWACAALLSLALACAPAALAVEHEVVSWGGNGSGQLGADTSIANSAIPLHVCASATTPSSPPPACQHLTGVLAVSAGGSHSLALLTSGEVVAWGSGAEGALGDENKVNEYGPVKVCAAVAAATTATTGCAGGPFLKEVVAISAGDASSNVALLKNGEVVTWGSNSAGQLGDGQAPPATKYSTVPVYVCAVGPFAPCTVSGRLSGATAVSAAPAHDAAIVTGGELLTWGVNRRGQLGIGDFSNFNDVPEHVCALQSGWINKELEDRTPKCTGGYGNLKGVEKITFGLEHNIAQFSGPYFTEVVKPEEKEIIEVEASHSVIAFGNNEVGQLGDAIPAEPAYSAGEGGPALCRIATEETPCAQVPEHVCEPEYLWEFDGTSRQQCGFNDFLEPVAQISAGGAHSLALTGTGEVLSWGEKELGVIGDDSFSTPETCSYTGVPCAPVPRYVCKQGYTGALPCTEHLKGIAEISGGSKHDLARTTGGEVVSWGDGEEGQLGDGTPLTGQKHDLPVSVCEAAPGNCPGHLTKATAISGGSNHSLAIVECHPFIWTTKEIGGLPFVSTIREWEYKFKIGCLVFPPPPPFNWEVTKGTLPEGLALNPETGVIKGTAQHAGTSQFTVQFTDGEGDSASATFSLTVVTPPDLGRCVTALAPEGMTFSDKGCTKLAEGTGGRYEWLPGAEKAGFTTAVKGGASLTTVGGATVTCEGESGSGEWAGTEGVTNTALHFTGCKGKGGDCTSAGSAEGELQTKPLEGELGWEAKPKKAALDLFALGGIGPLLEYSCGGAPSVTVGGSVLVPVKAGKMAPSITLQFKGKKGRQKPEALEGSERDVLISSFDEEPEQTALTMSAALSGEEAVELNAAD
jgi:alpha-tubulin suppressor-like RCC1 family protein